MFSEPASTSAALAVSMSGPLDAGAELIPAPAADELSLLLLLLEPHALSTSAPIAVPVIRATRTVRRELTVKITPSETRPGSRGRGPAGYCIRGILPRWLFQECDIGA